VLRAEGKPEEALALAKKLGADDALPVNVRVQLGRTYAALAKVPEMIKVADSMKDMQDAMALTFVGDAYRRVGDHARARQELDGAIKNNLDHDPSRALRALTILEDDDATNLNVAIDDLNSLKELGKDSVGNKQRGYASLGLAIVGDRLGRDHRENEREMSNAKTVLGGDPEVPFFEARQIFTDESPDYNKAIELAQAAIKADKVRLAPYLTVVKAATRAKNFAAADKALADAQAVFGDNLELGLAKGIRLRDEGRFDDAIASLKAMMPGHDVAEVYREIGKVYLRMPGEHKADAVEWLKKAAEKAKNRSPATQANVFTELGKAYAAAGDHQQAREIYGQSLAITSEYSVTYYWLAVSLKELKEDGRAKEACKQYVKNEPNGRFKDDCIKLVQ